MPETSMYISVCPRTHFMTSSDAAIHEVNGMAVAFHDRIVQRLHGGRESKHVLIKRNGLVHVGDRQHRTYPLRCGYSSQYLDTFYKIARNLAHAVPTVVRQHRLKRIRSPETIPPPVAVHHRLAGFSIPDLARLCRMTQTSFSFPCAPRRWSRAVRACECSL